MKRISSLLLSLITIPLIIGGCSNSTTNDSNNTSSGTSEPCVYSNDEQGLAFYPLDDGTFGVAIGYATELSKIEIPATFRNKKVTEILEKGFVDIRFSSNDANPLKSITIPETIKKIDATAFYFDNLKEFIYEGTTQKFSEISFATYNIHDLGWYSSASFNPDLKFVFSDKTFRYSEAFNSLCVSFNDRKYQNFGTRNLYIENQDNSFSVYRKSKYSFFRDELISNDDYEAKIEDETIVSRGLVPLNVGSTKMNIKCGTISMTLNLNVSHLQSMSDDICFENEYFNYDGLEHSIGDIKNLPLNTYVYYSNSSYNQQYSIYESMCNRGIQTEKIVKKKMGRYIQYAYLFIEGYYIKQVSGYFVINDKVKNDYINSISTANHLYIHYFDSNSEYNDLTPYLYHYNDPINKVTFDWKAIGTYGGAYIDVELGKTYSGNEGDIVFKAIDDVTFYMTTSSEPLKHSFYISHPYSLKLSDGQYCYHVFFALRSDYWGLIDIGYVR